MKIIHQFAGALLAAAITIPSMAAETIRIYAGSLLADPASGKVLKEQTILIENGKVQNILAGYIAGEGEVIDLRQSFVLPGLIDSHVHITGELGAASRLDAVTKTSSDMLVDGTVYAKRTLDAGFTTVVDLGSDPEAINALRDGIKAGKLQGPRIIAAGSAATHSGHGDVHGFTPNVLKAIGGENVCTGADDCARVTRQAIQHGADIIKIASTGGVLSDTAAGVGQQMTDAEIRAVVQAAHALGRKVACHAHGTDGINAALRAGVDSIEHGSYLDAESIKLFVKTGAYLVPTLLAGDTVKQQAETADWMSDAIRAKALQVGPVMQAALRRAHKGGVKIAFGTDSGVSAHGQNWQEFPLMVAAGMTPLEALQSATVVGAQHLGLEAKIGTLATGMEADIIAVTGDPIADISSLQHVSFVMKGGVSITP